METVIINATKRDLAGRKTEALRAEGKIPAVVYGYKTEPVNVTVDRNEIERVYSQLGESSVFILDVEGTKHNVLLQDVQRDPITDFLIHADFRAVNMDEKVQTTISLELTGVAPAVKNLGGTLVHTLEEVEVEALPTDLVSEIEVDISVLATFDDVLHISNIAVPKGITILNDVDEVVATVQAPRTQEEMEDLDAPVENGVDKVEVTTEKKDAE